TITGKDVYGCATRRSKGTCGNRVTLRRQPIEMRVLAGLKDRLMAPEMVEEFVREYQAEVNHHAADAAQKAAMLRREATDIDRKIAGILRAIEDGNYNPTLTRRLTELERQKVIADAALEAAGTLPVVRLHPNLAEVYRDKVAALEVALNAADARAE